MQERQNNEMPISSQETENLNNSSYPSNYIKYEKGERYEIEGEVIEADDKMEAESSQVKQSQQEAKDPSNCCVYIDIPSLYESGSCLDRHCIVGSAICIPASVSGCRVSGECVAGVVFSGGITCAFYSCEAAIIESKKTKSGWPFAITSLAAIAGGVAGWFVGQAAGNARGTLNSNNTIYAWAAGGVLLFAGLSSCFSRIRRNRNNKHTLFNNEEKALALPSSDEPKPAKSARPKK